MNDRSVFFMELELGEKSGNILPLSKRFAGNESGVQHSSSLSSFESCQSIRWFAADNYQETVVPKRASVRPLPFQDPVI